MDSKYFFLYDEGFRDGYENEEPSMMNEKAYLNGYADGIEKRKLNSAEEDYYNKFGYSE